MTTTFSPSLNSPVSRVRQFIGDTNIAKAEVEDETISAYLATLSEKATAAQLAYDLAAKYSRLADTTVDDQLTRFSHISENYRKLAERLAAEAATEAGIAATPTTGYTPIMATGIGDCRGPLDDPCCDLGGGYTRYGS